MSSITDVAREANVAISTVSLVYNNPERVSPSTRKKVEDASLRLGYRPRSARQGQKMHLAIVYSKAMIVKGSMVEYCRQWMAGIRESMEGLGGDVSVLAIEGPIDQDPMFQRSLEEGDFGGMMTLGIYAKHGHVEAAIQRGLPVVCVNRIAPTGEFSTVTVDYHQSGTLAGQRLASMGHRKVGVSFSATRPELIPMRQSFAAEIVAAGGAEPIDMPPVRDYDDAAGFRRMARFMLDNKITACFQGDPVALRLSEALTAEGADVPNDVSLIGLDNLHFRTPAGRRLTSVGYNAKIMGQNCAQLLQTIVASRGEIRHMTSMVRVRLFEGETVAPAVTGP